MGARHKLHVQFWICVLLIAGNEGLTQDIKVDNVRFQDQGETILIHYDLHGDIEKKFHVSVMLSYDYGQTFEIQPRTLSGDVGKKIAPGKDKEIVWHMTKDYASGLIGDGFVFAVTAKPFKKGVSKLPYYVLGTGIVGSIIYLVQKDRREENTLAISVPSEF